MMENQRTCVTMNLENITKLASSLPVAQWFIEEVIDRCTGVRKVMGLIPAPRWVGAGGI